MSSSDSNIKTRGETGKHGLDELVGRSSKKLKGEEEGEEGGQLVEHTALPGTLEVLKDGS